jgi:hypothetical protein
MKRRGEFETKEECTFVIHIVPHQKNQDSYLESKTLLHVTKNAIT